MKYSILICVIRNLEKRGPVAGRQQVQALKGIFVPLFNIQEQSFWSNVYPDMHSCCKGKGIDPE
jgi:hypothetical protein